MSVKSAVKISSIFVAFLENTNFNTCVEKRTVQKSDDATEFCQCLMFMYVMYFWLKKGLMYYTKEVPDNPAQSPRLKTI